MATISNVTELLGRCTSLLMFTGAGVSTASGIPDFRGPEGLWTRMDPDDFTVDRYLADPLVRRRWWQSRLGSGSLEARPNAAHAAITRLWEAGRLVGCVTQNVDGLHRAAGMPASAIVELHGTSATATCIACQATVDTITIADRLDRGELDPPCLRCGGILKTDVVMFGETLPIGTMKRAAMMAGAADGVIAVGTTLGVFPAASIPLLVAERGMPFVIINRGPTELDGIADLVVDDDIPTALSGLVTALLSTT